MSEKMTKAELEEYVVELEARIEELESAASSHVVTDTDPRRDVAEVARELRGES